MYADLPRDLQLQVIKHFDMDTRIKCGIIGRLKVPQSLKDKLVSKKTLNYSVHDNRCMVRVDLGRRLIDDLHPIYTIGLCIDTNKNTMFWTVANLSMHFFDFRQ